MVGLFLDLNMGKVKVNLSLSTPLRHTGGAEVLLHTFLTLVLDGGEWSTTCRGRGNRRIDGLHCRSICFGREKNRLTLSGFELLTVQHIGLSLY
jgi:hypothetical protein